MSLGGVHERRCSASLHVPPTTPAPQASPPECYQVVLVEVVPGQGVGGNGLTDGRGSTGRANTAAGVHLKEHAPERCTPSH